MNASSSLSQAQKEVEFVDGVTTVPANFLSAVPFQVADPADAAELLEAVQDGGGNGHGRFFAVDQYSNIVSGVESVVDPYNVHTRINVSGDDVKAIATNGHYTVVVVHTATGPAVNVYELDRDGTVRRELLLDTGAAGVSWDVAVAGKYAAVVTGRYVNLFDLSKQRGSAEAANDLAAEWEYDHTTTILAVDLDAYRVVIAGDDVTSSNHVRAIGIADGLADWSDDAGSGGAAQNAVATDGLACYYGGNGGTGGAHVQKVGIATGSPIAAFDAPVLPNSVIDLVVDDRNLYVATTTDLYVINKYHGHVERALFGVSTSTARLAVDDRFLAVVQNSANTVALLDKATLAVVTVVPYDATDEPLDCALDNAKLWIGGEAIAAIANENVSIARLIRPGQLMQFIDYRIVEHGAPRLVGRMSAAPTVGARDAIGGMYVTGNSTGQTSITTAEKLTQLDTEMPKSEGVRVDTANDRIYAVMPAYYKCTFSLSFSGTSSATFTFEFRKNGTLIAGSKCVRKLGTSGDVGNAGGIALVELAPGDYVEIYVSADSSSTCTVEEGQFLIEAHGEQV